MLCLREPFLLGHPFNHLHSLYRKYVQLRGGCQQGGVRLNYAKFPKRVLFNSQQVFKGINILPQPYMNFDLSS